MTSVSFTPSPELFPFSSRWLETDAGKVHYVDEGVGQPILMCHGNPTWSFLYRGVIARLQARFRCIALDYPGFGLSDRPDDYGYTPPEHAEVVRRLIAELDLRELIVMGHDWGGPIGLAAACADPDRVSGLVLGNTWFWPSTARARMFSRVMTTRWMQKRILEHNFFVERVIPLGTDRDLSEDEMDHYRGVQPTPEARRGVAVFPWQLRKADSWLEGLSRVVPAKLGAKRVLVTYPMRDPAFPAKPTIRRMREAFSDIEVVELPRARHYFVEDDPETVAAAIAGRFSA